MSVASTVVLLRALKAQNTLHSENGRIAVGWLIVEDLAMVLTLVLLPPLARLLGGDPNGGHPKRIEQSNLAAALGLTLIKVTTFIAFMLVFGRRLFPWLIKQVERTGSRKLFTLAVVAIALGAFFSGVVVNESDASHRAASDLQPLEDIFAVLFFVSVGMLFDPGILMRQPLQAAAVVGIIVIGKSLAAAVIVLALGRPLNTALMVSAALAQIGEFSFILGGLGLLPPEGYNLILAGALLSIILNPFIFQAVTRLRPAEAV